jgi:ABC-type molybdate transport system substrate-binding protein
VAILVYKERPEQSMTQQTASLPRTEVVVYHAGSLNAVISDDIGPGFITATGFPLRNIGGPSVELANQIRSEQIQPDVFMSADAEVNQVLMGRENGAVAPIDKFINRN